MPGTELAERPATEVIDEAPASSGSAGAPPKRRLKRSTKIVLAVVALVSVVELLAFSGTYFLYSSHYVSTDNARVDGDQIALNAPIAGSVTDWTVAEGDTVRKNQVVGSITATGGGAQPKRVVKSPGAGVIAVNTVVDGQYISAGVTLAVAYDPSSIYITARVKEDDIAGVHVGQLADISVDAYPGRPVLGTVTELQAATAGQFAEWPGADTDPTNPQKVDQYVPVRIAITNADGVRLLPGMNVDVHIER